MINVHTVAVMLRALARGDTLRAPLPPSAVARVRPAATLSPEDGSSPALRVPVENQATRRAGVEDAGERVAQPARPGLPSAADGTGAASSGQRPSASGGVALSAGGALLLEALNAPAGARGPVIRASAPLLASPPREPPELARMLRNIVSQSGLFYESHVARWAAGEYPLEALAREPQAAWAEPAGPAAFAAAEAAAAGPGVPSQTAAGLVRAQIETHEAHRMIVSAELWPGQPARLEFEQSGHTREHRGAAASIQAEAAWTARIDIALASLGEVRIVVGMRDAAVHCRLVATSADSASRLGSARDDLAVALGRQAMTLAQCAVCHESQ